MKRRFNASGATTCSQIIPRHLYKLQWQFVQRRKRYDSRGAEFENDNADWHGTDAGVEVGGLASDPDLFDVINYLYQAHQKFYWLESESV